MKSTLVLFVCIILLFAPLAGCLGTVSLDGYGYVVTIGVDKGKDKEYFFTLALQRELGDQDTQAEGGAIALTREGSSIFDAVNGMEGGIPYSLNFSRTNFIVMSRELAESGALKEIVGTSFDSLKIRTSAVVLICEGRASEFVGGMYANNDANITKLQSALMTDKNKTGIVSFMSVSRLLEAVSGGRFDYCSAYGVYDDAVITGMSQKKAESEGENPLKDVGTGDPAGGLKSMLTGAALFSGWSMTGTLDREETMFLNIATGEFRTGVITLGHRDTLIAIQLKLVRTRKRVNVSHDLKIEASATVLLEAAVHLKDESISSEEADAFITETLPRIIEDKLNAAFEKCRDASCDAMRFGTEASKCFRTVTAWEDFCWKERYPYIEPRFFVTVRNVDKYISEDMQ